MTDAFGLSAALFLFGIIIFVCVLLNNASSKRGIPMLLAFILFGVLCGNVGSIPIYLDDSRMAERVCTVALIFIMFYGGFGTSWKSARKVAVESGLLATAGVIVTALLTGLFCRLVLKWDWAESLLLGAVLSSTDAASVFSILRSNRLGLKNNTAPILEVESGSNDPAAYMLTAVMISVVNGEASAGSVVWMVLAQIGLGAIFGLLIAQGGVAIMRRMSFATSGFDSLTVLAIAVASYALPDMLGGNGYLSAYIVGIALGNNSFPGRKRLIAFFDGITGLVQMIIFFMLGLLARPALLWKALPPALAIAAALLMFARPAAVALLLTPFRRYPARQQGLVSFAGLRGASSIVFAIVAITRCMNLEHDIFSIVFCVVLVSIGVEGSLVPWMARKLGMVDDSNDVMKTFSDFAEETALHFSRIDVEEGDLWDGIALKDARLPKGMLVCRIARPDREDPSIVERMTPDGNTVILAGDIVILCSKSYRSDRELSIRETEIDEGGEFDGKDLAHYCRSDGGQVLMILRGGMTIVPNGSTVLRGGDILYSHS